MRIVSPTGSDSPNSVARDRLPDQRDLRRRVEIGLRELAARGERPFARDQVVGRDAEDLRRPVAVAEHDLARAAQLRRRDLDLGNLARHQERVVLGKGLLRPRAHAHAARREVARQHDDEVGAQALDLVLDARLRARADRRHRDHRAHADDDAEHRQGAAQLVDAQRGERDPERREKAHGRRCQAVGPATAPRTGTDAGGGATSAAAATVASRGLWRWSLSTCPSRKVIVRDANSAISVLVRDQHDRDALAVQRLQQRHHLDARRDCRARRSARRRGSAPGR
jgi:hypothetical protein